MTTTKIQWTDATWNPVRGCTEISPGCAHCYAKTFAERWRGIKGHPYEQGFDLRLVPEKLDEPLRWKRPRMVFVNSMSDLFHEDVPDEFIDKVFAVMAMASEHTFQVLTKRPARMLSYLRTVQDDDKDLARVANVAADLAESPCASGIFDEIDWPFPNVWLGVSCEDQKRADERREFLKATPAAIRFVSYEPALGPVDWSGWEFLDWLIIGGESGTGARPFDIRWANRSIEWCRRNDVAPFVKQLGAHPVCLDQMMMDRAEAEVCNEDGDPADIAAMAHAAANSPLRLSDKKGGAMDEWPADVRVREFPTKEQV